VSSIQQGESLRVISILHLFVASCWCYHWRGRGYYWLYGPSV